MKRTYGLSFCFLLAIDRLTKALALVAFPHAALLNQKAFFFFAHSVVSLFIFFVLVLIISWWFFREVSRVERVSFTASGSALIAAGAWSNFFDAARYGGIIDWIVVPGLTVLNLADMFIISGCLLAMYSTFTQRKV